jgi:hypothetical protein
MTMQDAPTNHASPSGTEHAKRRRPRALTIGLGLIALVAGLIAPASAFAASPTVAATDGSTAVACTGGRWPWTVQGAPRFAAGSAAGERLWHSSTGWHLRVTHPGTYLAGFSGTIRANKPLHVTGYRLESGDTFTVSADKLSVTYRFKNYGGLDGLDFTTECATRLGVSARMNGALLPVRRIWIGHDGRHPLQNPFAIFRRA